MLHSVRHCVRSVPGAVVDRAVTSDVPAIEALLSPEVARGTVLPRAVLPEDFWVLRRLDDGSRLLGCVALTPWSPTVVELGSVVAQQKGQGVGSVLVEAALEVAHDQGHRHVVVLTGEPGFFGRMGFVAQADAPWLQARQRLGWASAVPIRSDASLESAIAFKAQRCARCARLAGCRQMLMTCDLGEGVWSGGAW